MAAQKQAYSFGQIVAKNAGRAAVGGNGQEFLVKQAVIKVKKADFGAMPRPNINADNAVHNAHPCF